MALAGEKPEPAKGRVVPSTHALLARRVQSEKQCSAVILNVSFHRPIRPTVQPEAVALAALAARTRKVSGRQTFRNEGGNSGRY